MPWQNRAALLVYRGKAFPNQPQEEFYECHYPLPLVGDPPDLMV
jgi:hypothetical protein